MNRVKALDRVMGYRFMMRRGIEAIAKVTFNARPWISRRFQSCFISVCQMNSVNIVFMLPAANQSIMKAMTRPMRKPTLTRRAVKPTQAKVNRVARSE